MKIKPNEYARAALRALDKKSANAVAKNLWFSLQKNNQYRDLKGILTALDEEFAKLSNKRIAYVYSAEPLDLKTQDRIRTKLKKRAKSDLVIKNLINKNVTGIVVKIDDLVIDLSLQGKIEQLKQTFAYGKESK